MRFASSILLSTLLVVFSASIPAPLGAQGDSDLAETHFKAATAYYNQGKYEKALEEFIEAYRLMPLPEVTYNMAQCYERLGKIEKSVETYKKYLEEKPDAKDIQAVKDKIDSLEKRLEKTGLHVEISEEGALVYVDGVEVGTSPIDGLIKVAPGSHDLTVEKEGFQTFTMNFSVSAGLTHSAKINLTPTAKEVPEGEGKEGGKEGGEEPVEGEKGSMTGYIVAYALSGAVLVGGGVTGALALVYVNKANDASGSNSDAYDRHESRAKKFALATDVLIPAGVAGLVITSIVLGVKKPWKERKKELSVAPFTTGGGGGLLVGGSF